MRWMFDLKYLKRRPEDVLSGSKLASQFNVVDIKRLRKNINEHQVFCRSINPQFKNDEDHYDAMFKKVLISQKILYFRKRIALNGLFRGILEFFLVILLVIFKFCLYMFTLTFVFFCLNKYHIHAVARYLITKKYQKDPVYDEYYYTLNDRLEFTKNMYNAYKNKKVDLVDFYDLYLSTEAKNEINNFEFPTGFHPFESKLTQPLNHEPFYISPYEKKIIDATLKRRIQRETEQPFDYDSKTKKEKDERLLFEKKEQELENKYNAIMHKREVEAKDHILRNIEYAFALDKQTNYLLQSSGVEVLNPFDRLTIANDNTKGKDMYTYPKQKNKNILTKISRFNYIKEPFTYIKSILNNNPEMFNSYQQHDSDNIYFSDSKHVFISDKKKKTDYLNKLKEKKKEDLYKNVDNTEKELTFAELYYKNYQKKFYDDFFFQEILENILLEDASCFEDIKHDMTCWSTYDIDTNVLNERILYPHMEFFSDHDCEFYTSRYAYGNLFFSSVYPEPNLTSKIGTRRVRRVDRFNSINMSKGKRYEKELYFKPIDLKKKNKKKKIFFKDIEFVANSASIQLDFDNFLLYLYIYLKEDNNPIIICLDKFISIFF